MSPNLNLLSFYPPHIKAFLFKIEQGGAAIELALANKKYIGLLIAFHTLPAIVWPHDPHFKTLIIGE